VGTSQLKELAASGCGQRAQRSSGTGPPSRERFGEVSP